ncbi:unnamed protein product [Adineta steineri]|uniref:Nuclear envelope membrane protein n=1 Tax=Adineta steineri TaxID=433720 RepID=A0A815HFV8_9BILA|nr:unnamed protein product [Adineta steineri]CAF1351858.1 unnamed protein product [Adineta steineri]
MISPLPDITREVNILNRIIWFLMNILFGGFISMTMLVWVSCDMEMPNFFFPVLPSSSFIQSIFHVPWIDMKLIFPCKILFNAFLFALFGFVHTFFARNDVQQYLITRLSFPPLALRTFYLISTNITAWLLMGLWQHTSIQLWDFLKNYTFQDEYRGRHLILLIVFTLINLPGMCVVIQFDSLEFFGFKQIYQSTSCPIISRTTGMNKLVTDGIFKFCRHPMYLFLLLGCIISPSVSLDKFLFIIYAILYLYIAIPIEEKKLEKIFGQAYIDYKNEVPSIIPKLYNIKKKI